MQHATDVCSSVLTVCIKIFTASDVMWKQMWHKAFVTMQYDTTLIT
jgi:hypothetical protein